MSLPRGTLIGEYRIEESLGAGGMGAVYRAVHTHLGRVIAIKVLSPGLADGPALRRFYSEAAIQASLRHPGVAEYFGFYEYQGRPCLLMEYVDGETLTLMLQRRGPLPAGEAVNLVKEIALVAAHFHSLGVVHRDLKSSNVKVNGQGRVKILDFGIAQHQQGLRLTQVGAVIGTPAVLAPEQLRGEPVSQATDVWQLGVLLYELLTARLPFEGTETQQVYAGILSGRHAPLEMEAGRAIRRIVDRCLEKEPGRRYGSARELSEALSGALAATDRKGRAGWPWPSAAAAALVTALLLVAGYFAVRGGWGRPGEPGATASGTAGMAVSQPSPEVDWKTVLVDTADGAAEVYREGVRVGMTPFAVRARPGESVQLILRREGFRDLAVQFQPSERRNYTYTLEAQQMPAGAGKER